MFIVFLQTGFLTTGHPYNGDSLQWGYMKMGLLTTEHGASLKWDPPLLRAFKPCIILGYKIKGNAQKIRKITKNAQNRLLCGDFRRETEMYIDADL